MPLVKKIIKLTIKQKCEILEKLKEGASVTSICNTYSVNKSTVCRIKKQKYSLEKFISSTESGPGRRYTLRKACYPKMEKALHKWFLLQRQRNVPISGDILRAKARSLYKKISGNSENFNASVGWLNNFKKRYGIRYLKVCGEKLTNKPHLIEPFKQKLEKKITELSLTNDQIYNADESGLFLRLLPDHTFVSSSEKSAPGRKLCKQRITFMPCMNASGEHKLKLMVIGKSAHPRAFKEFHNNPVFYRSNQNAWMTSQLFKEWFQSIFVPNVRRYLESKGLPKKALLLIDNATCHPHDGELQSADGLITTMSFPPNCTALIQPLDQNIIRLIKCDYKKSLLADLVATKGLDLNDKLKKYNLKTAVCNLANAWKKIAPSSIINSWKNIMSENSTWSEEDLLPLSVIKEQEINQTSFFLSLLHEITTEGSFSEVDVNRWINEVQLTEYTTEHEIEDKIESESDDVCVSSAEENNDVQTEKVKIDDAVTSINTVIKFAEENDCPFTQILILKDLRDFAMSKKFNQPKKQTKISNFFNK